MDNFIRILSLSVFISAIVASASVDRLVYVSRTQNQPLTVPFSVESGKKTLIDKYGR